MNHKSQDSFVSKYSPLLILLGLAGVLGIGMFLYLAQHKEADAPTQQAQRKNAAVTINYTSSGFSPRDYTVEAGKAVAVHNNSNEPLEFSSGPHPTHFEEPELNLPLIEPGKSASFIPTKKGTWSFHDHVHDQFTGTLTVQ